jgi:hypothetical protein
MNDYPKRHCLVEEAEALDLYAIAAVWSKVGCILTYSILLRSSLLHKVERSRGCFGDDALSLRGGIVHIGH